jgi:biopolymer transport protein ExbD
MNASQLRFWVAAPMAGLFLVLGLCAFIVREPQASTGLPMPIPRIRSHSSNYVCEDDRQIVVRITEDGRLWINQTGMTPVELKTALKRINEYRSEHVAYLIAAPSTPYQKFADTFNVIRSSVTGMHVILITPRLQRYFEAIPRPMTLKELKEYPICPLEWKENGYEAPSIYSVDAHPPASSNTH